MAFYYFQITCGFRWPIFKCLGLKLFTGILLPDFKPHISQFASESHTLLIEGGCKPGTDYPSNPTSNHPNNLPQQETPRRSISRVQSHRSSHFSCSPAASVALAAEHI